MFTQTKKDVKVELKPASPSCFLFVRVGSNDKPAVDGDIENVRKEFKDQLGAAFAEIPVVVTHHNVDVQVVDVREPESLRQYGELLQQEASLHGLV